MMKGKLLLTAVLSAELLFAPVSSGANYWVESASQSELRQELKVDVIVKAKESRLIDVLDMIADQFHIKYVIKESNPQYKESETGTSGGSTTSSTSSSGGLESTEGGTTEGSEGTSTTIAMESKSIGDLTVNFYYKGKSGDEAVKILCESADVYCYKGIDGVWYIEPYATLVIEKSFFFDYEISGNMSMGGTGGAGGTGGSATGSSGGSSSSASQGDSISLVEKYNDFVEKVIRPFLSPEGKVVYSPRGYLAVFDRPSRISDIRRIVNKEKYHEKPIRLKVRVIRLDLKDEYSSGIDWSSILRGDFGQINLGVSTSGLVQGPAGTFSVSLGDFDLFLNLLGQYGNVEVVKSWDVKAKSGTPYFFNVVEQIPYFTQDVAISTSASQVSSQVNYTDVGLKIKVLSEYFGDYVEGGIYVEVSEFLGFETQTSGSGDTATVQKAPRVARTNVAFPLHLKLGDSTIITGFRTHEFGRNSTGVPWLSKFPILGYLFGYKEGKDNRSELIIVVTPEDANKSEIAKNEFEYYRLQEARKAKALKQLEKEEEEDFYF